MVLEVIGREVGYGGRVAGGSALLDWVLASRCVGKKRAGLPLRLLEREQGTVLSNGHSLRCARVPVPVLDDVAAHARGLDPQPEAGKRFVPDYLFLRRGFEA